MVFLWLFLSSTRSLSMSWRWTWFCESYRIMLINYFLYFLQILYILWYSFFLTRLLSFSWWTCVFESYRIMITSDTSFRSDTSWRSCFHRISDLQLTWYRVSHAGKKSINWYFPNPFFPSNHNSFLIFVDVKGDAMNLRLS